MAADYPWTVDGHSPLPYPPDAPSAGRRLVVASGSNASPLVMARKLGHPVPLYAVEVGDLAVGHSAHIARRGYIPAAPFLCPGHTLRTSAALLDDNELAALDATEPNYYRVTVRTNDIPLILGSASSPSTSADASTCPATFDIYMSRFGVLGDPGGEIIDLRSQRAVFTWLDEQLPGFGFADDPEHVCTRLADPAAARITTAAMRTAKIVCPSGLAHLTAHLTAHLPAHRTTESVR